MVWVLGSSQRPLLVLLTGPCFLLVVGVLVASQVMKGLNRAASVALVFGRVKVCPQVVQRQRGRCLLVVPCFVERAEHTGQVGLIFLITP